MSDHEQPVKQEDAITRKKITPAQEANRLSLLLCDQYQEIKDLLEEHIKTAITEYYTFICKDEEDVELADEEIGYIESIVSMDFRAKHGYRA